MTASRRAAAGCHTVAQSSSDNSCRPPPPPYRFRRKWRHRWRQRAETEAGRRSRASLRDAVHYSYGPVSVCLFASVKSRCFITGWTDRAGFCHAGFIPFFLRGGRSSQQGISGPSAATLVVPEADDGDGRKWWLRWRRWQWAGTESGGDHFIRVL